jgi:cytochrome c biogenesis protein CcmG/thiol:disulfide interchange protein DsbE
LLKRLFALGAGGIILGVGLSFFVLAGFNQSTLRQTQTADVGGLAPDFKLNSLSGVPMALSQFKGKPVLINFWASWCEPCKQEMPLIESYAKKYSDKLVVIGLDSEESPLIVQDYINRLGIKFTILIDSDGSVSDLFRINGFPTTVFIDPTGRIQAEQIGSLSDESMQRSLSSIGVIP